MNSGRLKRERGEKKEGPAQREGKLAPQFGVDAAAAALLLVADVAGAAGLERVSVYVFRATLLPFFALLAPAPAAEAEAGPARAMTAAWCPA